MNDTDKAPFTVAEAQAYLHRLFHDDHHEPGCSACDDVLGLREEALDAASQELYDLEIAEKGIGGEMIENKTSTALQSKTVKWVPEEYPDLSHYGTFSDHRANELSIDLEPTSGRFYSYFNAENVENKEQARENLERVRAFERGEWDMLTCYAEAEFRVLGTTVRIQTPGIHGIEEPDEAYRAEISTEQLTELDELLAALKATL